MTTDVEGAPKLLLLLAVPVAAAAIIAGSVLGPFLFAGAGRLVLG